MVNEIAKVLECESTYLMGYDSQAKPLSTFSDIINFFCLLDRIKDINFEIETKRPPHYDGWECTLKFNGKDRNATLNQDICLFLEEFERQRDAMRIYQTDYENFLKWQDQTLAYHASSKLEEKEIENLPFEERMRRFQEIMNERYGKKES